ncbi:uncharacterized protein LOC126735190 [Anthonomus grandis grandis]|uniref:uncharacterized protein LOC126735190 n=1 Tax=Anthonomus grandis grandis TaxID=2921223 RepID=UPI002165A0D1|nr:uncharacterized protein LOC126735190 [Anthonomus grandis grandis]
MDTEKLIELVRERKCLWDQRESNYHHSDVQRCLWKEVSKEITILEEYRERRCLWDTRATIYKNKQARDSAYKEIEEIMGIEGFGVLEIKNKKRRLRSTYSQEKKKIRDSMKSGAGSEDIYVLSVKWFKEMDTFLRNVKDNKRPTQDNFNIQREEGVNEQKRENEEEIMAARNETSQEVPQKKK